MKNLITTLLLFTLLTLSGCASSVALSGKTAGGRKLTLLNQGISALDNSNLSAASDKFNAALELAPSNAQLHFLNAVTYHMRARQEGDGYYPLAEQGYSLALKFAPAEWYYYLFSGLCKIDQKQYLEAKLILADGLFLHANDADLVYAFLYACYYDMDIANATAALSRLRELEPDTQRTSVAAVILAAARGDITLARSSLQQMQPLFSTEKLADHLKVRIDEWDNTIAYYASRPAPTDGKTAAVTDLPAQQAPDMIVLDATIIRNEEESYQSTGINLLDGLKIEFGEEGSYGSLPAYGTNKSTNITKSYDQDDSGAWILSGASKDVTSAVTQAITLPALSYSLNIFNSGGGRSEVLARPTLVAALNKESHFFAGTEINAAVRSDSTSDYSSSTSINLEVGVRLTITPDEITSNSVRMHVKIERSYLTVPSTDLILYDYMVTQSKTEVAADVVIRYGETLMLSGLLEKETMSQKGGTTLLQDIPIVKYFFSNKTEDIFHRSMLIMLTPYRYVHSDDMSQTAVTGFISHPGLDRLKQKHPSWYTDLGSHYAKVLERLHADRRKNEPRGEDLLSPLQADTNRSGLQNRLNRLLGTLR